MRNVMRMVGVAVVALATVLPISAARSQSAPYCGIGWGSLDKKASAGVATTDGLTGVRAGRHACFDRLVLDGASWVRVRYVDRVYGGASGEVVPLRGGARLEIVTSRADDVGTGELTYTPANPRELVDVNGWRTFRQAADANDFEGQSMLGLGVRARLPFRVFVLATPGRAPRVVIDVAHRW